jgi:hypothetical protein
VSQPSPTTTALIALVAARPDHLFLLDPVVLVSVLVFVFLLLLLLLLLARVRVPAAPPPALCLLAWPALPVLFGWSRKGSPARSGGLPFLERPGLMRVVGRGRGGRGVRLLRRTTRGEQLETNAQRRTPERVETNTPRFVIEVVGVLI